MREINKLTVSGIKAKTKAGLYADGLGLYLQVAPGGSKSWLFRFMRDGRARKMGLGSVHTVPLKEARERATECRKLLLDDIDPIEARKAQRTANRLAEAKAMTFKECADGYIASHRSKWSNLKHARQWTSTLEKYVYDKIGQLPVNEVDVTMVVEVLNQIWTSKPETASRVRGRIERVLDWATVSGYRTGDNPARWKGHLDNVLPARNDVRAVKHHPAMPYSDVSAFVQALREMEGVSPRALEFAILTAARTGEVVGARWSEIDISSGIWIIPAERMKSKREHRVPLSKRAIDILQSLPHDKKSDFVFIGDKAGATLSNMALLMTLRRMGRDDVTVHGFRSTFKDWATERTTYPNEMTEMALAHVVSDKTEAAYRRGQMVEKRHQLMEDWARHCDPESDRGNVVSIKVTTNGQTA